MSNFFDKALGVHQHTASIRAQRAQILSSNIANADTPGYKAKDINFEDMLQAARSFDKPVALSRTHQKHLDLSPSSYFKQIDAQYRQVTQNDTGDGNTVDLQKERNAFLENALEHKMSVRFLSDKFNSLKKVIKGA